MKLVHAQKTPDNALAIVRYAYELLLQLNMKGCQTASFVAEALLLASSILLFGYYC